MRQIRNDFRSYGHVKDDFERFEPLGTGLVGHFYETKEPSPGFRVSGFK